MSSHKVVFALHSIFVLVLLASLLDQRYGFAARGSEEEANIVCTCCTNRNFRFFVSHLLGRLLLERRCGDLLEGTFVREANPLGSLR